MTVRLALDASNLVRDRRGMGRLARAVVREAGLDESWHVTLLAGKGGDRRSLRQEFMNLRVEDARLASDRRAFDVTFFPFNGMRFSSAAPSLVLLHDVFAFTEPHPGRIARFREQAPIRRAAREGTAFVTTTQWNRGEIARELGIAKHRVDVIAPVPDAWFVPAMDGGPEPAPSDRPYVLAVGGGESRKNLAMLVDACARSLHAGRERLIVAGTTSDADRARAADLGLDVVYVDADDELLRRLYRSAALVAVPSRAEGFGLVAVEAMACGAPVLAGAGSGLTEATRGAARLLGPDDRDAWVREIRTLLDDDAARAALAASGSAAFAGTDRTAHARGLLAALRRTASGAPSR